MKAHAITHQGLVRDNNEDRSLVWQFDERSALLVLSDGMGGHAAGERAAEIAVATIKQFDRHRADLQAHLIGLVESANRQVQEAAAEDPTLSGMGTTLTALFIGVETGIWVHVGDSRLCLFRNGSLTRLTTDHTVPGLLLSRGEISAEAASVHPLRNMLLRCIGCGEFSADTGRVALESGDTLLLSSDGLHDYVDERQTAAILGSPTPLEARLEALLAAALATGGRDNITVVGAEL